MQDYITFTKSLLMYFVYLFQIELIKIKILVCLFIYLLFFCNFDNDYSKTIHSLNIGEKYCCKSNKTVISHTMLVDKMRK
jgi:hypothetical protein